MQDILIQILRDGAAAGGGTVLGLGFGALQQAALRRHEIRAQTGQLGSGWSLMPGAGVRVAYLLVALALVQVIAPLLFVDGTQWIVSAGLVVGYGWTLLRQLRRRLKAAAQ